MRLSNIVGKAPIAIAAGEAIAAADAVEVGPDNLAYKVLCTDTAAVAVSGSLTNAATGMLQAETALVTGASNQLPLPTIMRPALLQDLAGNVCMVTDTLTSSSGITLHKYTSGGRLLGRLALNTTYSTAPWFRILEGTNGNLGVFTAGAGYIVSPNMTLISSAPIMPSAGSTNGPGVCTLAAGGYAIVEGNGGGTMTLVTADNTGAQVLAPAIISASFGAALNYTRCAQLSNGNLVWTTKQAGAAVAKYGIVNPTTGAPVLAATDFPGGSASGKNYALEIVVTAAGFAIVGGSTGTNGFACVFNNAGVQQGSNYSTATTGIGGTFTALTDGTSFYAMYGLDANTLQLARLSAAGAVELNVTVTVTALLTAPSNTSGALVGTHSAFIERGRICVVGNMRVGVIDAASGALVKTVTPFGSAITSGSIYNTTGCCATGDYAFAALYDGPSGPWPLCFQGKYADSAVAGCALVAAAKGADVKVQVAPGSYATNAMRGTNGAAFNHTANTTLAGNKGALLRNGIVLNGYGT